MPRALLILFVCLCLPAYVFCQYTLRGKVIASDTRKPIALANVYLSNTTVGTITDEDGGFVIAAFPQGRFDLVVSFIGYETYSATVQSGKLPSLLEIVLVPKVNMLQEVIVEPYEKNGWEKWGQFFIEKFIGTSANAKNCKLLNKEVVKFRHNKKNNTISAFADETLLIENNALGYRLKYDLTKFEFNFNTSLFYYQGYPFFEDMETRRKRRDRKWNENRQNSYYGSQMHFMRSLYRNRLIEEGFEVRKLIKIPEAEKKRVRAIYGAQMKQAITGGQTIISFGGFDPNLPPDSVNYYRKVMQQPEQMNVLVNQLLPGDSIAYGVDSTTAGLYFTDYLQVTFPSKKIPAEYAAFARIPPDMPLVSELTLPGEKTINVLSNGIFFEGLDLLSLGYWAWSEKICNMLPFEYKPPKKE
jgi:hypothetical protein